MFRFTTIFMLVFSIAATVTLGPILLAGGRGLYDLVKSQSYPTTTGTVVEGAMTGGAWSVRYSYSVAGRTYESMSQTFPSPPIGNDNGQAALARAHPVGSRLLVHYDERHPEYSVLTTAISGWDFVFLMFGIMPLSFVISPWVAFFALLRWDHREIRVGGCRVSTDASGSMHVRMPNMAPLQLLSTLGLLVPLPALFVVVITLLITGTQTLSVPAGLLASACAVGIIVGFPLWAEYKRRRGDYDLVIDSREVSLPATFRRKQRYSRRRDEIQNVRVEHFHRRGRGGGDFYLVWLSIHQRPNEQIAEFHTDCERAESLARWLGDKLGKPVDLAYRN